MKTLCFIIAFFSVGNCETNDSEPTKYQNLELRFLNSYIIPAKAKFEDTEIGGLSGIDFDGNEYFLICDQPSNPRFYKAKILIGNNLIDTVIFTQVVELNTQKTPFFRENVLDMEAIRFDNQTGNLYISSEGSINNEKDPTVFQITTEGKFVTNYTLPGYFKPKKNNHPRNNGVFEGLSESWDGKGIWVSTELPLLLDGPAPQPEPTVSPVRVTYYDNSTNSKASGAERQFTYLLEPVAKPPLLPFCINGVSEILEIEKDKFLVLERGFSAGYGMQGNTIRVFKVDASNATNTLGIDSLKNKMDEIAVAEKKLLFDFETIRKKLPDGVIDNIEGFTFGPELPNGNKSLILVADNNFNKLGPQLNQLILMEIVE